MFEFITSLHLFRGGRSTRGTSLSKTPMTHKVKSVTRKLKHVLIRQRREVVQVGPRLPPEIWLDILGFLRTEVLQQVCCVNRLFLQAFLDAKYNLFLVRSAHAEHNVEHLRELQKVHLAHKVRGIQLILVRNHPVTSGSIRPTDFEGWTPHIPLLHRQSLAAACVLYGSEFRLVTLYHELSRTLPLLPHLDTFQMDTWNITIPARTSFAFLWDAIGSRVRHLSLSGQLKNFYSFFTPDLHLPLLTDLSLFIQLYSTHDPLPTLTQSVTPFIHRHASQLATLDLIVWLFETDIACLFQCGPFPNLHTFRLGTPYNETLIECGPLLHGFLKVHSPTLKHVHLDLSTYQSHRIPSRAESMPLADWMAVFDSKDSALTNLTSLSIFPPRAALRSFLKVLKRSLSTLRELKILTFLMSYEEVEAVCKTLRAGVLRKLQVTVEDIDTRYLELLGVRAGLESLTLIFAGYKPMEVYPSDPLEHATLTHLEIGSLFGTRLLNEANSRICRGLFPNAIVSTVLMRDERARLSYH